MIPERWRQVKDIFDGAVECNPASRLAYVRDRCGDDDELRKEVESLLVADTPTGSMLENPLLETGTGSAPSESEPASPVPNDAFGPYVPVRVLGEGGMGTVYLARQQQPIRRDVALKVVKLGMDSRQVLERFEIERQALALMDHPNVARVLDAGTSERCRPYFVMEYVDGVPITQYCDGKALSTRERLQLFIPVCKALQHAHKKGIIHRDVKPSNILVTEVDGKPVPKVIDFGVARATEQRSAENDAFTLSGQLIGTPEYMSPEQTSLDNRDIDTGTDVYSLGVVLYELLVGVLPLDIKSLRKIALGEVLRAIRETPVPKPTARIREIGAAAEGVAQQRSTNPGQLKRELAGDLDSIVMKAIDKDRHCRYASASEFATDIERYLSDQPVLAGPPSPLYRGYKFARRHRAAILLTSACCVAGIIAMTVWVRGNLERENSRVSQMAATEIINKVINEMYTSLKGVPGTTDTKLRIAKVIVPYLQLAAKTGDPDDVVKTQLVRDYQLLGNGLLGAGESESGGLAESAAYFNTALSLQTSIARTHDSDSAQTTLAEIHYELGTINGLKHDWTSVLREFEAAMAIRQHLVDDSSPNDYVSRMDDLALSQL